MTDEDLIEFAAGFREGMLGGGSSKFRCFMVCAPLTTLLAMHGVGNRMVNYERDGIVNHYWLMLDDGRVLDPTADQFNDSEDEQLPPVYLGPPAAIHRWFMAQARPTGRQRVRR